MCCVIFYDKTTRIYVDQKDKLNHYLYFVLYTDNPTGFLNGDSTATSRNVASGERVESRPVS